MTKQKHNNTASIHTTKKIVNWTQYSASLQRRGNFTVLLNKAVLGSTPKQSGTAGHPVEYADAIILFLAQLREFMQLPLRQTIGMAQCIFAQAGLTMTLPSYATLSRRIGKLDISLNLHAASWAANSPIIFLPDSTGLKISGEGEWKVKKHGTEPGRHRQWLKVHIGTDYFTRQIVAVRTTHARDHDNQSLTPLLDAAQQELPPTISIQTVIGDGAYDSKTLYWEVAKRGATLLVPPPKNALWHGDIKEGQLVDSPGWETRNAYVRSILQLGSKEWKRQAGYHKRSLAETSMFRLKRTFGGQLKSRTRRNQDAEVTIRISLLNLFTSYGLPIYETVSA